MKYYRTLLKISLKVFFIGLLAAIIVNAAVTRLRNVSIQLGSSATILTGNQGNSGIVQNAGTISGTSEGLCSDASGNTTTTTCNTTRSLIITSGICSTGGAEQKCGPISYSWAIAFPDNAYALSCMAVNPTGSGVNPSIAVYQVSKSSSGFSLELQAGSNSAGGTNTTSEIDCIGSHQ